MSSPHREETDLQPLPGSKAPLPTQRTSSPDVDNFLDPLLSLTPDKPQGISRLSASNHKQKSASRDLLNKENAGSQSRPDTHDGTGPRKEVRTRVLSSNPGVLFQQERSKQDLALKNQLKVIRHNVANVSGKDARRKSSDSVKDAKRETSSKESVAAARVNKLTKSASSMTAHSDALGTQKPATSCVARKPKTQKKHVRIVDSKIPLSSPELHSTAAMGHQLKQLETQTFNAEEVVIKTLQDSESARLALSEKVAEAANVNKNEKKYSGLVSLGVPVDETLQRAVTHGLTRVKRRPKKPSMVRSSTVHRRFRARRAPSEVPPPDILDMFSPAMIVESANLDTSGLIPPKVKPVPVDPDMTFDLYRHMQCWDLGQ